eukprot:1153391-Pelagomonas_calceolata.AAC.11
MLRGHPVPRAVLVMVGTQLLASALEQAMCTLASRLIQGLVSGGVQGKNVFDLVCSAVNVAPWQVPWCSAAASHVRAGIMSDPEPDKWWSARSLTCRHMFSVASDPGPGAWWSAGIRGNHLCLAARMASWQVPWCSAAAGHAHTVPSTSWCAAECWKDIACKNAFPFVLSMLCGVSTTVDFS